MSPTARRQRRTPPPDPFPERGLAELGLAPGDQVRFRRSDAERWKPATVARRERDGSVGLHDAKGASRAIPVACIEVRTTGPRGGTVWEPLVERAARTEQLALVAGRAAEPRSARRDRPPADHGPEAERRAAGLRPVDLTDPAPTAPDDPTPDPDPDGDPDSGAAARTPTGEAADGAGVESEDDGQLRLL